ncbi:MAG: pyridoxamine 5'-phosphate oxidase family protein [Flavobacteriaceae bacterium]
MIKNLKKEECLTLLRNNYIGHLGYIVGESPFVIPITYFYYEEPENSIISYSLEGHKMDAMRKNQLVALQVDDIASVSNWKSVLIHGTFEELRSIDAKNLLHQFSLGVKDIINRKEDKNLQFIHEFSSKLGTMGTSPIVYRIKINEITGKVRNE